MAFALLGVTSPSAVLGVIRTFRLTVFCDASHSQAEAARRNCKTAGRNLCEGARAMNETISTPSLFFKRFHGQKRQTIVDLISDSTTGLTRSEVAAAIDSPTNCVSVMINQINKELADQGWKINSTDLERQPGRRGTGAALSARAPNVRYVVLILGPFQQSRQLGDVGGDTPGPGRAKDKGNPKRGNRLRAPGAQDGRPVRNEDAPPRLTETRAVRRLHRDRGSTLRRYGSTGAQHQRRSTFAHQLRQLGDVGGDRSYLGPLLGSL